MRRLGFALLAALPTLAFVAARAYVACYPGCAMWTESNPEWYWFMCYLCAAVA